VNLNTRAVILGYTSISVFVTHTHKHTNAQCHWLFLPVDRNL